MDGHWIVNLFIYFFQFPGIFFYGTFHILDGINDITLVAFWNKKTKIPIILYTFEWIRSFHRIHTIPYG